MSIKVRKISLVEKNNIEIQTNKSSHWNWKQFYQPISLKYHQLKKSRKDTLKCGTCMMDFENEDILEYQVLMIHKNKGNAKLVIKKNDENEFEIDVNRIGIQLSKCKGEHVFHTGCIQPWLDMKGSCSVCREIYAFETGIQPLDGTFNIEFSNELNCDGFKDEGTIIISVYFPKGNIKMDGKNVQYPVRTETMYLPNNKEGREILELCKIAWKRRVLFTIGESITFGDIRITFNGIHFKTKLNGGSENHGYPDVGYFYRVKEEFQNKGITVQQIKADDFLLD